MIRAGFALGSHEACVWRMRDMAVGERRYGVPVGESGKVAESVVNGERGVLSAAGEAERQPVARADEEESSAALGDAVVDGVQQSLVEVVVSLKG